VFRNSCCHLAVAAAAILSARIVLFSRFKLLYFLCFHPCAQGIFKGCGVIRCSICCCCCCESHPAALYHNKLVRGATGECAPRMSPAMYCTMQLHMGCI
jgi:hypothetical protein